MVNKEEDFVYGRNAVLELLKSGKNVHKVYLKNEGKGGRNSDILSMLKEKGIPAQFVETVTLNKLADSNKHQGVVAVMAARAYVEPEDLLAIAEKKQEDPLLVVLAEVEDPHNLGAILRSAEGMGVHGIIISKRRSAGLTAIVAKTSAGAIEHVPVARVANIVQTLAYLKERGCWITGAEMGGRLLYEADLSGPRVLVIGGEDKGLGRLVQKECDEIVALPMEGRLSSLNASVAASILIYEAKRQRNQGLSDIYRQCSS